MPIFSFWGTGVITYETTMLGAVLATFGWFLWESGLIRKRDKSTRCRRCCRASCACGSAASILM